MSSGDDRMKRIEVEYAYLWKHALTGESDDELAKWFSSEEIDMIHLYRLATTKQSPDMTAVVEALARIEQLASEALANPADNDSETLVAICTTAEEALAAIKGNGSR